jgi:GLPGLI family protein
MKLKSCLILFLFVFSYKKESLAQTFIVSYEASLSEDDFPFDANLYIKGSTSLFQWKTHAESFWERQRSEGIDIIRQWIYTDLEGFQVGRNMGSPMMTIREFCKKDFPVIYEDSVNWSWDITEEKRVIEGYSVTLAKATFRGREYQAWFAEDIPIDAGPWKFHGLPGLIFEVNSIDGTVRFNLKGLKNIESESIPTFSAKGQQMTRKELVTCLDLEYEAFYKKNQAIIASLQAEFPDIEITDAGLSKVRIKTELNEN